MSGTANEFDEPGANYPDSAREADRAERSDAGVGGAISREDEEDDAGADDAASVDTQDGPALAQNETTQMERLSGIVVQVRADVGGEDASIVEQSLRRRLRDAGIAIDDDELGALARDIAG